MKKIAQLSAVVASLLFGFGLATVVAYQADPNTSVGYMYFLNSGQASFRVGTSADNIVHFTDLANARDAAQVDASGVQVLSVAGTVLQAMTPSDTGKLVFNTTTQKLCISSGPSVGAYIGISRPDTAKLTCF